jgi:hypothetical protein
MGIADCNYEYDYPGVDDIPPSGIVYCNIEHITKFFDKCKRAPHHKYVVVSGFSDFGLAYQKEHPVAMDMLKWLPFIESEIPSIEYKALNIGPRCDVEKCNIRDRYSIKCHSFTMETFDKIPDNVIKWFVVNPLLMKNKLQGIPIGVGKDSADAISNTPDAIKTNWLYVNWQNYTTDRMHIKKFFINNGWDWVTAHENPDVPYEEYLSELSRHRFVACPPGNGVDCYRILESIYLGAIPIVEDSPTMRYLDGLPILKIRSWGVVNSLDWLQRKYDEISSRLPPVAPTLDKAKLSYWTKIIRGAFHEHFS